MHRFKVFILPSLLLLIPGAMSAQTNQTEAQRWLAKAELAPAFTTPVSKNAWEQVRILDSPVQRQACYGHKKVYSWNSFAQRTGDAKSLNIKRRMCKRERSDVASGH
jgi:hypothetical protein